MVAALHEPPVEQNDPATRPPRRPPTRRIAIWGPLLVVLALAMMLIAGIWRHIQQRRAQREFAVHTSRIAVEVVSLKRDSKPRDLLLPGNITAMQETTLYARANGYVARWLADIGDVVKAGQALAELETPELDQQLAVARGNLQQSTANFELARVTAQRWRELAQKQVVAPQENDERQGNYQAAAAALNASKAEVGRLEQLQGFKKISAPFAGKITSRKIDSGALVSEGSGTAGTALYTLAETDPLRIFVDVPQTDAPLIQVGMDAKILVREYANRDFTGQVTRTSGAIDPTSRTLRVEVQIPNQDGALFAGMYAQVKFTLQDSEAPVVIPANVFVFRSSGTQVAILDAANKVHWQPIEVGRDFGSYLEVLKGLDPAARVVVNPTDDLVEGLSVDVKPPAKKQQASPTGGGNQRGED